MADLLWGMRLRAGANPPSRGRSFPPAQASSNSVTGLPSGWSNCTRRRVLNPSDRARIGHHNAGGAQFRDGVVQRGQMQADGGRPAPAIVVKDLEQHAQRLVPFVTGRYRLPAPPAAEDSGPPFRLRREVPRIGAEKDGVDLRGYILLSGSAGGSTYGHRAPAPLIFVRRRRLRRPGGGCRERSGPGPEPPSVRTRCARGRP